MMTTARSSSPVSTPPTSARMLRWTLRCGSAAIACEIDAIPDGSFDLRVVPSLAPSSGFVERFSKVTFAMERHAEMVSLLREGSVGS